MSPFLVMCLDTWFGAAAIAYLFCLGLYAESIIMLALYVRS